MAPVPLGVFLVIVTFFSTLAGGLFTLRNSTLPVKYFFAFAAGALLGVSFFDLMPEVITLIGETGISTSIVMGSLVIAFFFYHTLDRILAVHGMMHGQGPTGHGVAQGEADGEPALASGMAKATGLSIHSFLDGVAIGSAFHIGFELGLIVGLAVVFHDFSDGLNTVTVMLRAGATRKTALPWLLADALTPIVGALATFFVTLSPSVLVILLAFFIGEFLYLGAADLLPEAHQRGSSARVVLASILGVLLVFGVTRFLNL